MAYGVCAYLDFQVRLVRLQTYVASLTSRRCFLRNIPWTDFSGEFGLFGAGGMKNVWHTKATPMPWTCMQGSNRKCKQVVTVIWHKAALLPHTDCSVIFARSREYAPPHLTHASFGPRKSTTHTVSWSVQPFLHRLRLSVIGHVRTCPFTVKIAPSDGGSGAPSNAWFLGSSQLSTPNSISIVFAQLTADSPYTLQWAPLSPKNCPFSWGDLYPHLIHGYFGSPKSSTQTASQSVKPCRAHYGDRSTDHATWSVTMGHNDDLFAPHKFVLTHHMHNEVYWTFIEYFRVYFCRHC